MRNKPIGEFEKGMITMLIVSLIGYLIGFILVKML